MVSTKSWNGRTVFGCDECGFKYADIKTAEECEKFCKKHKACNPKLAAIALDG